MISTKMQTFKDIIKDYYRITLKQIKKLYIPFIILSLYMILTFIFLDNNCLLKLIVGYSCPGCGLTRAYLAFFRLDLSQALYYHPLFWAIPLIVFVCLFNERPRVNKIYASKWFWGTIFAAFIICFIVRMVTIFPKAPLDINFMAPWQKILRWINR